MSYTELTGIDSRIHQSSFEGPCDTKQITVGIEPIEQSDNIPEKKDRCCKTALKITARVGITLGCIASGITIAMQPLSYFIIIPLATTTELVGCVVATTSTPITKEKRNLILLATAINTFTSLMGAGFANPYVATLGLLISSCMIMRGNVTGTTGWKGKGLTWTCAKSFLSLGYLQE